MSKETILTKETERSRTGREEDRARLLEAYLDSRRGTSLRRPEKEEHFESVAIFGVEILIGSYKMGFR